MMILFDCKLTSISGVDTVTAAKLLAEIGDINRFPNADKLARFTGIAPVKFSSAGKGKEEKSKQGNRLLHGINISMILNSGVNIEITFKKLWFL